MAILTNVSYLLDPAFQVENINGKPAVGGHIEVYLAGTDTKYITFSNWDGTQNPFKIPLANDGRATVLASNANHYDVYVYDSFNNLMFSRLNVVTIGGSGSGGSGGGIENIINTDGFLSISQTSAETAVIDVNKSQLLNGYSTVNYVDESAQDLREDILDEVEDRENADTELHQRITTEATERTYADAALGIRIDGKQDKLTAGDHIEITDDNTINVVGEFGKTYTSPEETILVDNTNDTLESSKYYIDEDIEPYTYNVGGEVDEIEITTNTNKWSFERTDGQGPYSVYFELPVYYGTQRVIENHRVDDATEGTYPTNAFEHEDEVEIKVSFGPSIHSGTFTTYTSNGVVKKEVQEKLEAGDNISIDGKTISVVDKKELHVASPITWDADTTTIGFDDSAYAKTTDIPTDFYTKAQTDSAIASAVADKATTSELNTVKGTLETSIGEVESQVISVANSLSTNYYTKTQVDGFLQNWSGFVVIPLGQELPAASEAQLGKIYLWKKADAQEKDNYEEWISDGTAWSKIGSMEIDLSNYYTKTEVEQNFATLGDITRVEAAVNDKISTVEVDGVTITGNGVDIPLKATADLSDGYTLEAESAHGAGDIQYINITDDTTNKKTIIGLSEAAKQAITAGVNKQDKLTAGDGIDITGNTISCTVPKVVSWSGADRVIVPAGKKWTGTLSIILRPSTAKGAGTYCGPRHPDNNIAMLVVWPEITESMVSEYLWFCQTIAFEYDNRNNTEDKVWDFSRGGVLATEISTTFNGIEE